MQEDARTVALSADPSLSSGFVCALFGALYEVFNSMVSKEKTPDIKICTLLLTEY